MDELENLRKVYNEVCKFCDEPDKRLWWIAQIAHETKRFTSKLFVEHNNPGGIVYIGHGLQEGPATQQPLADTKGKKRYSYAHYASLADGIAHMWLIIRGALTRATSLADYIDRLAARHYFGDDPARYYKGVKFWSYVLKRDLEVLQRLDEKNQNAGA